MSNSNPKKRWLTVAQVRERYGNVSHMWVERRLQKDPDFPRFVKFGRMRFADEAELDEWDRICAARGRGEHDADTDTKRRPAGATRRRREP
jgi:hypothetical protein